tara:strand:+ start:899 stop:1366 length:468 start_codon:yes stop_codon:yes gene_type:complete
MRKIFLILLILFIIPKKAYSNEADIETIKNQHNTYYEYLFKDDFENLSKLFSFPAVFKGFVKEIQIANNQKEIINIYQKLIKAAPQSKFARNGRDYTEISTELESKLVFKMRDDTYLLIANYTQKDKKNNSIIFSGSASYLFTKNNDDWLLSGVF